MNDSVLPEMPGYEPLRVEILVSDELVTIYGRDEIAKRASKALHEVLWELERPVKVVTWAEDAPALPR